MQEFLSKYKGWFITIAVIIIGAITGAAITININNGDNPSITSVIEYSDKQIPAVITEETGQGAVEMEVTEIDGQVIPTVESVESDSPVTEIEGIVCPEGEECARGAAYPQLDISSPQAFANDVLGKCIDVDGYYGAQCWDLAAAFHYQYTGRVLTTCGTGAAKGVIADGCWQINNSGDEYEMVWNPYEVIAGAQVYFRSGLYGHVGFALGPVHDGYITLLGQNQGGASCPNGGSAVNIINISIKDFVGAMMPKIWVPAPEPEPEPEPVANTCDAIEVVAGDTMGDIMQRCEGEVKWGDAMNNYANNWFSDFTGNSVFWGWTHNTGYGLFAGDTIRRAAQ